MDTAGIAAQRVGHLKVQCRERMWRTIKQASWPSKRKQRNDANALLGTEQADRRTTTDYEEDHQFGPMAWQVMGSGSDVVCILASQRATYCHALPPSNKRLQPCHLEEETSPRHPNSVWHHATLPCARRSLTVCSTRARQRPAPHALYSKRPTTP